MFLIVTKIKENSHGMTLLEVLVALILLSLITINILTIYITSSGSLNRARRETTASHYCFAVMENLRENRNVLTAGINHQLPLSLNIDETPYKPSDSPIMQAYITMNPRSDIGSTFDVIVTVEWLEGQQIRTLSMVTILRKMEINSYAGT